MNISRKAKNRLYLAHNIENKYQNHIISANVLDKSIKNSSHFSIKCLNYLFTKMRKTWVKKENIYYKPFYKQKLKITLLGVILMAIIFFAYQIFYIKQLQTDIEYKSRTSHQIVIMDEHHADGGSSVATNTEKRIIR